MKEKLGIQLFSVRDYIKTYEEADKTIKALKNFGYVQAQTAGCAFGYDKLGELVKKYGIEVVGTHFNEFEEIYNDFDGVAEKTRLLGATNIGVGACMFASLDAVNDFIIKANEVAKKAAAIGMKFTYHNHSHEFGKWENGKTTMEMLTEGLDKENITFCFDTYWVQHAGGDVCAWIERLAGRIDIIHLKDMMVDNLKSWKNNPAITEVGSGNMDWQRIINSARKAGVKYYIVEQDINWNPDCISAARKSYDYLRNKID